MKKMYDEYMNASALNLSQAILFRKMALTGVNNSNQKKNTK